MRFMLIRRADAATEAGAVPSPEIMAAMEKYMEEMQQAGVLVEGMGLKPSSKGALVRFEAGKPRVIDGPFAEAKELIAGFSLIDVPTLEDAIAWARRWPAIDMDANVALEIRPLFEESDFAEWQETWQQAGRS